MPPSRAFDLEDLVTAVYCALDDALREAHIQCHNGKLVHRRGPAPEMDDREVLCLAVLQELLGYESDNAFFERLERSPTMQQAFPRLLSRQKFAERRALLTPLIQRLCQAFCALGGEAHPPFPSLIPTPSTSVGWSESKTASVWTGWPRPAIARRTRPISTASANT